MPVWSVDDVCGPSPTVWGPVACVCELRVCPSVCPLGQAKASPERAAPLPGRRSGGWLRLGLPLPTKSQLRCGRWRTEGLPEARRGASGSSRGRAAPTLPVREPLAAGARRGNESTRRAEARRLQGNRDSET